MGHWHNKHWFTTYVDSSGSVFYQCLAAVKTAIQNIGLSGVADASIVVKKLPLERVKTNDGLDWPVVLITPRKTTLNRAAGDNVNDDVVYGVLVTVIAADNQESTLATNLAAYTLWLEQIRKVFHNKRLTGVNTIYGCAVEPSETVNYPAWTKNLWVSGLLLKFDSREHRGS